MEVEFKTYCYKLSKDKCTSINFPRLSHKDNSASELKASTHEELNKNRLKMELDFRNYISDTFPLNGLTRNAYGKEVS